MEFLEKMFRNDNDCSKTRLVDRSGTAQSQFFFLRTAIQETLDISDAQDVNFQMKGLSSPNFEVTLFFKILHFAEEKKYA